MLRSALYRQFMERLPIRTKAKTLSPLKFNTSQERVWNQYIAPRLDKNEKIWLIILKARQLGISTMTEALILARTALVPHVHSLVMASRTANTKEIWNMSKLAVERSPLKGMSKILNKEIHFETSNLRVSTASTEDAVRGFNLNCLHGSEVASWQKPESWLAVMQCLPQKTPTICVMESTAKGKIGQGELFYSEWRRAVAGKSDFVPVFLPWYEDPDYTHAHVTDWMLLDPLDAEEKALAREFALTPGQLSWRRFMIRTYCMGDVDHFRQEYPCTAEEAFIVAGRSFFNKADLLFISKQVQDGTKYRITENGKPVEDHHGPFTIYKLPEPGHRYIVGADSSMGLNVEDEGGKSTHSRSAMEVIDMDTLEQVAEYDASTPPHIQARHMVGVGRLYREAMLAPEVQSSGGGGGREIIRALTEEFRYWNIHQWKSTVEKIGVQVNHKYGWETNARSRPRMLYRLREAIMEQSITIHSERLLTQLQDFGENDAGRLQARQGHDDLLFAYGIALMCRSENYVAQGKATTPGRLDAVKIPGVSVIDEYAWLAAQTGTSAAAAKAADWRM